MYRGAIASILSELVRQDRLRVIEQFDVDAPKTGALAKKLGGLGLGRTLLVTESGSENLYLAARNNRAIAVVDSAAMDPVSLVNADHVLMTVESVKKIEEWLR
jgi:large subunit ribosomal protein L4